MGQVPTHYRSVSVGIILADRRGRRDFGGGGNRGMPKPSAPIMDINNIHTELQWKLGSRG